ncbi:MAG: hypothetical protein IT370_00335 [Deltaproteobacteria bacterium]|nr:hypothetical protein [Deltaproteobacteria bacterium]
MSPSSFQKVVTAPTRLIGIVVLCILGRSSVGTADTIVLDVGLVGEQSVAENRRVQGRLVELGCVDLSALVQRVAATGSISGMLLDQATIDQLRSMVDHGFRTFQQGQFVEAIAEINRALAGFAAAPATVAEKQELRDTILRAHVGLALAHSRLGQTQQVSTVIGELIRLFPDREVSRREYGPEALQLVKQVRAELDGGLRGGIHVEVTDDPGAVVFVNERYISVGKADLGSLIPGTYRVYVSGRRRGRVHLVDVKGGETASLRVNLEAEALLQVSDTRVALIFPTQDDALQGLVRVGSAVRDWLGAERVILLHTQRIEQRRLLVGVLLESGADKPVREGAVLVGAAQPADAAALADLLVNGTAAPDVLTGTALRPQQSPTTTAKRTLTYLPAEPWYRDKLGWALLATGVVTAGVGGGFLWNASTVESDAERTVDEFARRSQLERADDRRLAGLVLLPAGAAIAVLGAIKLAVPGERRVRPERVSIVGGANFLGLAGAF